MCRHMNNFSGRRRNANMTAISTHYKDFGFAQAGNESGPLRGANGNASLSPVGNTVVISKGTMIVHEFVNFLLIAKFHSQHPSSHPQTSPGYVLSSWQRRSIFFVFIGEV
jgi:hypothetical protein